MDDKAVARLQVNNFNKRRNFGSCGQNSQKRSKNRTQNFTQVITCAFDRVASTNESRNHQIKMAT
jgi:hypothetical protein